MSRKSKRKQQRLSQKQDQFKEDLEGQEKKQDLCKRCGQCCRLKIYVPEKNVWSVTGAYCPYFSWVKREAGSPEMVGHCTVYKDRAKGMIVAPGVRCVTAEDLVKARLQPNTCPYTKDVPGYRSRVIGFP